MKKLWIMIFAMVFLFSGRIFAQDSTNTVILVVLSKSVATNNHNSPCKENFEAVSRVIANVPAGAKITILGITADSFADPDVLLSAKVSGDRGYFVEKLASAHQTLNDAWQKRNEHLECNARGTDILGAILVAAQIFKTNPATHSKLLIFSDMRQNTKEVSLGMIRPPKSTRTLNTLAVDHLIADLHGVSVEVLGADNAGDDLKHWQQLETFWRNYFRISKTTVCEYPVMRDVKDQDLKLKYSTVFQWAS